MVIISVFFFFCVGVWRYRCLFIVEGSVVGEFLEGWVMGFEDFIFLSFDILVVRVVWKVFLGKRFYFKDFMGLKYGFILEIVCNLF